MPRICAIVSSVAAKIAAHVEVGTKVYTIFKGRIKLLWNVLADKDNLPKPFFKKHWGTAADQEIIASRIFSRINEFPLGRMENGVDVGMEAIEGLFSILKHSDDKQIKRAILAIFDQNWIGDAQDVVKLLRLMKQADEALPSTSLQKGLRTLLISTKDARSVQGTWYQLAFMKKHGFANVEALEVARKGQKRGVDVVLKHPANPRFFELKSGSTHNISEARFDQMLAHMTSPPVSTTSGGWRRYRLVINSTDPDIIPQNGGRVLKLLLRHNGAPKPGNPDIMKKLLRNLKRHLKKENPNLDFNDFLRRNKNYFNRTDVPDVPDKDLIVKARKYIGERLFKNDHIPEVNVNVPPRPGTI